MSESSDQERDAIILEIVGEIEPHPDGGYTISIAGESFYAADVAEMLTMATEAATKVELGYAADGESPGHVDGLLDRNAEADQELEL
jgi:hypothetical protein